MTQKLKIRLNGPPEQGELVDLIEWAGLCQSLAASLKQLERSVLRRSPQDKYLITGLAVGSAVLELQEVSPRESEESPLGVFKDTVKRLNRGRVGEVEIDDRVDWMALEKIRAIYQPILRKKATSIEIGGELLSERFVESIDDLLAGDVRTTGSVKGRLERLNIHRRREFMIYPAVGTTYIRCEFPKRLMSEVASSVNQNVTVHGELRSMRGRPVPMFARVERIEKHPPEGELPSLMELRGISQAQPPQGGWVAAVRARRDAKE